MYSTNATAIKRSPLRSTAREEKEGEREKKREKEDVRAFYVGAHPIVEVIP